MAKHGTWLDRLAWRLAGTKKAQRALGIDHHLAWSVAGATKAVGNSVSDFIASQRVTSISRYDRTQLYAASVMAYAAANYRAINMAQVPMQVIRPDGKVINDPNSNDYQPDNPLVHIFRPGANYSKLMRRNEYAVCFWGWTLNHIGRNTSSIPVDLMWINPYEVEVDADNYRGLCGFRLGASYYESALTDHYILPKDAVFLHTMDFRDDFDGVAPAEAAFMYAEADGEIAQTYAATFRNMAVPALFVQPTADYVTEFAQPDADRLSRALRQIAGGAINAGRTLVSPNRVEMERLQPILKDLDLGTVGAHVRDSIALAFSLPIDLLMMNSANLAQAQEARRSWAENWLVPQAQWYADGYTEQLAEKFGEGWRIEPSLDDVPALRENTEQKQRVLTSKLQSGAITYGRYNQELNEEVVPELENMVYIPALQAPVPVSEVPSLWQKLIPMQAPGVPPQGGFSVDPAPPAAAGALPPLPAKAVWVDDDQYAELKNLFKALKKHGNGYDFQSTVLPGHVISYVKNRMSSGDGHDVIMQDARVMVASATKQAAPVNENLFFETLNLWDELGLTDLVQSELEADNPDSAAAPDGD